MCTASIVLGHFHLKYAGNYLSIRSLALRQFPNPNTREKRKDDTRHALGYLSVEKKVFFEGLHRCTQRHVRMQSLLADRERFFWTQRSEHHVDGRRNYGNPGAARTTRVPETLSVHRLVGCVIC